MALSRSIRIVYIADIIDKDFNLTIWQNRCDYQILGSSFITIGTIDH